MQLTVTIRDADEQTLNDLAAVQWRNPEQQASAMLEQALRAQQAKADRPAARPRRIKAA